MTTHTKGSKLIVTAISIGVGIGLKKLMRSGWKNQYHEDPPDVIMSENLNWGKLVIWTFMTGVLLRIIKVALKRSLSVAIKKHNLIA